MGAIGFTNTFTTGEVDEDARARDDIQPVAKSCQQAQNLVIRTSGPLGKRRGLWLNGSVTDPAHLVKLIPFRRSVTDALVLEFGNLVFHVWSTAGALLSGPYTSPYTDVQAQALVYKQVADVIYFRDINGVLPPQTLTRNSNTSWTFAVETFPNGPWRPENIDTTSTITVTKTAGSSLVDAQPGTGAGAILPGATVTLAASKPIFNAGQVGSSFRLRAGDGTSSARSWTAGTFIAVGSFCLSVNHVYECTATNGSGTSAEPQTPPVQLQGSQSDGGNTWLYLHDGAGVVQITAVSSTTAATGVVLNCLPFLTPTTTSFWAENGYSTYRGWPTMWPAVVEDRFVSGATSTDLDTMDLTGTAGFSPTSETYDPQGAMGSVLDVAAIRARLGDTGAQALWGQVATFLLVGTEDGEYIVSGGLFGEPITPSTIVVRPVSSYGSAPGIQPVRGQKGLLYVARGGQTLREIATDPQQNMGGEDHSFLATHISSKGFAQLAWVSAPDNNCWLRMADGSFACFTYQAEQEVKGFTSQLLGGGLVVEDEIVMPGPGNLETLWIVAHQANGVGGTNRLILMQSQVSDQLFMDCGLAYVGAATNVLNGLALFNGMTVDVLANNIWYPGLVVAGGAVHLPTGVTTTNAQVGFTYPIAFTGGRLNLRVFNGAQLQRQRIASAIVDVKTYLCRVGGDGVTGQVITAVPVVIPVPAPPPAPAIVGVTDIAAGASLGATTLVLAVTADSPAGNLIHVWAVYGAASAIAEIASVTDSAGNTYLPTSMGNMSVDPATGIGSQLMGWYAANARHLPIGGTISVNYSTTFGNRYASAVSVAGAAVTSPKDVDLNEVEESVIFSSSYAELATGPLAQANEVVLGAVFVILGDGDTFTGTPGFTDSPPAGLVTHSILRSAWALTSSTASVDYNPGVPPFPYVARDTITCLVSYKAPAPPPPPTPSAPVGPARIIRPFNIRNAGNSLNSDRDPRIVINEQTPFDFVLYAIKQGGVVAGDAL